jgi:hypothetical protein
MAKKKRLELTVAELMDLYRVWYKQRYHFDPDCHGGIAIGLHEVLSEAYPKGVTLVPGKIDYLKLLR